MTFLNASLLAGLLAIAIPVAVHLISRRQPRRVIFPATRFLQHRMESSRSKLRVRRWWLLALRILAIAAFAVALARPQIETSMAPRWFAVGLLGLLGAALLAMAGAAMAKGQSARLRYGLAAAAVVALLAAAITGGATAAGGPEISASDDLPVAMAIVIDNSIRTSRIAAPTEAGETAPATPVIDQMRSHAHWMIGRYASDSRIAIIDRSQRPAAFAVDVGSANRQIERTEPLSLTRPLSERIEAAVRLVRSSDLQRRMVLVITDLTAQSFPDSEWTDATTQTLLAQDPAIRLQILDVGTDPAGNRKLSPLVISDVTPPRLTPTAVSTLLQWDGPPQGAVGGDAGRSVTVEMQLFDTSAPQSASLPIIRDSQTVLPPLRSVDRTTVNLATAATRVLLSVPPLEVGTHHGLVRIVGDDELPIDDRRYFTLQVRPSASVLLVAADRESAGVIGGALTAPLAIDDEAAEYKIEVAELLPSKRENYANYEAIVLIDPVEPSPAGVADLEAYLAGGGKLISMLGPSLGRVATDASATTFPQGTLRRWRVPPPGTFLEIARPNHPAVLSLGDIAGGVPWNLFPINQYWQLQTQVGDTIVMRYAGTDHPALVERRANRDSASANAPDNGGIHLILTTPLPALAGQSRGWNDLFAGTDAWPAFLLVREMMQSLIDAQRGTHNLLITDLPSIPVVDLGRVNAPLAQADSPAAPADRSPVVDQSFQMFPPTGPPVPLRTSGPIAAIGNVETPGTYWLRGAGTTTGFSVNLLPNQTDLTRIDPTKLQDWLGAEQYDLVRNRDELREAEGRGAPTRPLYGWILLLMAGAFVMEQVLSNRFYRSGRTAATGQAKPAAASLSAASKFASEQRTVAT